jgi:LmbE family N-acetylglucosaminyl deacetylase
MPKITKKKSVPKKAKTKLVTRKVKKPVWKDKLAWVYLGTALFILLISVVFWSLLGAKIQSGNADQIVNSLLFANRATFAHALLPSQHSFLLKWPIFYLIHLFGVTSSTLITFTILTVVLTVGLFVLILCSIEKRPLYLGTICLAMASVLMLIPVQPYAGGLLPVNMAMIATRNLEYIVYIYAVILLIKSPFIKSKKFWLSIGLMSILIASDKLFFTVSVGAALLAMFYYAFRNKVIMDNLVAKWLIVTVSGFIGSAIILWLIVSAHITHFSNQTVGPYGLVTSLHSVLLAVFYGISGAITNLGANPASSTTIIHSMPASLVHHFFSLGIIGYVVNIGVVLLGICIFIWEIRHSLTAKIKKSKENSEHDYRLAVILGWTTLATFAAFIVTNHTYSVDSRYLTIVFFTIFVAITSYSKTKKLRPEVLVVVGGVLLIGIISGSTVALSSYNSDKQAMSDVNVRDHTIAQALKVRKVDTLVGDYWRVIPTKLGLSSNQTVTPLLSCEEPRQGLSSSLWQPNLHKVSFAYLLSLSGGNLTNYPNCSINQVTATYGRPNSSILIKGTLTNPQELLLFYDNGISKSAATSLSTITADAVILPTQISSLPAITCNHPTIMNIVAHQDDDLLFMNPDIIHELNQGYCERSVYITAGDAGEGIFYYISRQKGSEAAYAQMLHIPDVWIEKIIQLAPNEYVTMASPKNNTKVTLVFFRLPDGGLENTGFAPTGFQTITRLFKGNIKSINSVDGQSSYTLPNLENALINLMTFFTPAEIRTQSTYNGDSTPIKDHPDHNTVGAIVTIAAGQYNNDIYGNLTSIPIEYYEGYPIRLRPANVFGNDLLLKEEAFITYGALDQGTCSTIAQCSAIATLSSYLQRQYQMPN